jgi:uncharacterized membrane protein YeaQ/YmgE (transglycosylase-associated protein family)
MAAQMHESDAEDSTFQLVIDQLEELVVTIVEEIRERPGVVLAIFAGIVGALVGSKLASRRRALVPKQAQRSVRGVGDAAELAGLGMRVLRNPIVRGMIMAAVARQFRRVTPQ